MGLLSRIKTWVSNEVLTALDLNAEFDNIHLTINGQVDADNIDQTDHYTWTNNNIHDIPEMRYHGVAGAGVSTAMRVRYNPLSGTQLDNDGIKIVFQGEDDTGVNTDYGAIECRFDDVSNTTETGMFVVRMRKGTTTKAQMVIGNDRILIGDQTDQDLVVDCGMQNALFVDGGNTYTAIGRGAPLARLHVYDATGVGGEASGKVWYQDGGNATADFTNDSPGLLLTVLNNAVGSEYGAGIQFGSTYSGFASENPKSLAGIAPYFNQLFNADTDSGTALHFFTSDDDGGAADTMELRWIIGANGYLGYPGYGVAGQAFEPDVPLQMGYTPTGLWSLGTDIGISHASITSINLISTNDNSASIYFGADDEPRKGWVIYRNGQAGSQENMRFGCNEHEVMRLQGAESPADATAVSNLLLNCTACDWEVGDNGSGVLQIGTGVVPTTYPVDSLGLFCLDLTAGNTMLGLRTEGGSTVSADGTTILGSGTPTANRTVAIRINNTTLYLLAATTYS